MKYTYAHPLADEAFHLVDALRNASYQRLVGHVCSDATNTRATTDPYIARVNRIAKRAQERAVRRLVKTTPF